MKLRKQKLFIISTLTTVPIFSLISCVQKRVPDLINYNNDVEITQNIYRLQNELWNPTNFSNEIREKPFLVKNSEDFKNDIIQRTTNERLATQIKDNWELFSNQVQRVFGKDIQDKYYVIYYANYAVNEPMDSVEIDEDSVKIHYISYGNNTKQIISGQYFIFIDKNNVPNINSITVHEVQTRSDLTEYNRRLGIKRNKVWFSK